MKQNEVFVKSQVINKSPQKKLNAQNSAKIPSDVKLEVIGGTETTNAVSEQKETYRREKLMIMSKDVQNSAKIISKKSSKKVERFSTEINQKKQASIANNLLYAQSESNEHNSSIQTVKEGYIKKIEVSQFKIGIAQNCLRRSSKSLSRVASSQIFDIEPIAGIEEKNTTIEFIEFKSTEKDTCNDTEISFNNIGYVADKISEKEVEQDSDDMDFN